MELFVCRFIVSTSCKTIIVPPPIEQVNLAPSYYVYNLAMMNILAAELMVLDSREMELPSLVKLEPVKDLCHNPSAAGEVNRCLLSRDF